VSLWLLVDQLAQVVEVEFWSPTGELLSATLSLTRLERLLTSSEG
jgi:hypothetical protein